MSAFHRALGLALAFCAALAGPAAAQDEGAERRFGDDLYVAGEDVRVAEAGLQDIFAAGQTVSISGNIGESVHALARRVQITGSAGRDVYAAARDIELRGVHASRFTLATAQGPIEVELSLPGLYNVYNATAAATLALALGSSPAAMSRHARLTRACGSLPPMGLRASSRGWALSASVVAGCGGARPFGARRRRIGRRRCRRGSDRGHRGSRFGRCDSRDSRTGPSRGLGECGALRFCSDGCRDRFVFSSSPWYSNIGAS